jgi:hypothetical protein
MNRAIASGGDSAKTRWLIVVLFAAAMAWVESAVVYYLRTMLDRIEPYQPNPLPILGRLGMAEVVREMATLVMLITVGRLAGQGKRSRLGYALIAFGVWDILYYVFLKVLTDWPRSLLDWDILFLIPLPWWGPVLAPMLISGLMILWGTLVSRDELPDHPITSSWITVALASLGVVLALYVFMADSLRVMHRGGDALRQMLPVWFNWPLFSASLLLMAAPVAEAAGWRWRRPATSRVSLKSCDCPD